MGTNIAITRRWRTIALGAVLGTGLALVAPASAVAEDGARPAGAPTVAAPAVIPPLPPVPGIPDLTRLRDRAEQAKARFDRRGDRAPDEVASWGVDPASGQMVVDVIGPETPETRAFTADSDPATVTVRTGAAPVRPLADLRGGGAIFGATGRCSIGAAARDGAGRLFVLTAGHCTRNTTSWTMSSTGSAAGTRVALGPASGATFPRSDFGRITVTNTAVRATNRVIGGPNIIGSAVAPVGSQVCRSGSTTGYRCGVIQATNQTVNYPQGPVFGLVRTSACGERGDSGGTFVTPAGQAQGLLSGGSGDCRTGGATFYEPIRDALSAYRLQLVTR